MGDGITTSHASVAWVGGGTVVAGILIGGPLAFDQEIVIPTDLTSDRVYYLGAIVDADGEIAETDEGNNATYVAIRIK